MTPWRPRALPAALPVLAAAALTLPFLSYQPLWLDEVDSASAARRSWEGLGRLLSHQDAPLGTYYAVLHVWTHLVGLNPVTLRLPSALGALVAVALTARLGRRLGGAPLGVLAASLMALNPVVLEYALMARPYALTLPFAVGLILIATRSLERQDDPPSALARVEYAVVLAVGVHLHIFFVLVAVAHAVWLLSGRRPLRPWLLPWLLAGLASAPLLLVAARQTAEVGYLHTPGWASWLGAFQSLAGGTPWLSVPCALLVALAIRGRGQDPRARRLLVTWMAVPPLLLLGVSLLHPFYLGRYVIESVPALSLLSAAGLLAAFSGVQRRLSAPRPLAVVAAVALGAVALASSLSSQLRPYRYEDLRAASDVIVDNARPSDAIVYGSPATRAAMAYYLSRLDSGAPRPRDLLLAPGAGEQAAGNFGGHNRPAAQAARLLEHQGAVWLVQFVDRGLPAPASPGGTLGYLAQHFTPVATYPYGGIVVVHLTRRP